MSGSRQMPPPRDSAQSTGLGGSPLLARPPLSSRHWCTRNGDQRRFPPWLGPSPEKTWCRLGSLRLALVAARKEEWSGSVVLYLGDNTNVQDWLRKRQAGNSQANFLLKVLGALEGVHGLHIRGAYLRTYHNQTADDLTRLEPEEVMRSLGLKRIEVPPDWSRVLEEAWVKHALLWLGQPEADRGVALQLAERRARPSSAECPARFELSRQAQGIYERAFISHGGSLAQRGEHDPESRLCVAASVSGEAEARRILGAAPSEAESIWLDSFRPLPLDALKSATHADEWELWSHEYDGRSFQDQVWWKRWVIAGVRRGSLGGFEEFLQSKRAELEPCTPLLHTYATHWVDPKPTWKGVGFSMYIL